MFRIFITFLLLGSAAHAKVPRAPFEGIRPAGMGNAYTAIADDLNALFYNPAGLARIQGAHWNLIDFNFGADNKDSLDRLKNAFFKNDTNHLIRLDRPQYLRIGVDHSFLSKYFAFALYDKMQGYFDTAAISAMSSFDPLNPDYTILQKAVDVYMANDIGAITGFGIPVGEHLSLGFSCRLVQRTAIDLYMSATDLLQSLQAGQSDVMDQMYGQLMRASGLGWGIGLSTGALIRVPTFVRSPQWFLSAVVEDVGQTSFRPLGGMPTPPPIKPTYVAGTALRYVFPNNIALNLAMDLRTQFTAVHFTRTFNLGAELQLRALSLRFGVHDAYLSYGAGLQLAPHTKIEAASYGFETGSRLWQNTQRRYLMRLVIGFNAI